MKPVGAIEIRMDLTEHSFGYALEMLFINTKDMVRSDLCFTLCVPVGYVLEACKISKLIKECGWHVGIFVDTRLEQFEWSLSGNGLTVWSHGA